jgi:hypothetical protein
MLLLRALVALACLSVARSAWNQLGDTVQSSKVSAISLDSNEKGDPAFAYGYSTSKGTSIPIREWNGKTWVEKYNRVSQFPQAYDEFKFQVRNNNDYYLGLRINGQFGSVLSGKDKYTGCYAFTNKLYDYDIAPSGDMHMLWISEHPDSESYPGTNNSLVVTTYAARGWSGYPASNAFGKQLVIDHHTKDKPIDDLAFLRNPANGDYYGAYVKGKKGFVFQGSLKEGFTHSPFVLPNATTIAMDARSLSDGTHVMCIAVHWESDIRVFCTDNIESKWLDLGTPVSSEANTRLPPEISIADDGTLIVVAAVLQQNQRLAVRKLLPGTAIWTANDFKSDRNVTHYDMHSNGKVAHLAVSENHGEGLRVLREKQ